jgi:putative phage-type endonuclease
MRQSGIGGSDASAILGLNPYCSPFDVYADKLGSKPPVEDNEAMRQGRDLEDYVARRFCETHGKKVRRINAILQHEEHDFIIGNVDRIIVGEDAGLECKTTSVLNKAKFNQGEYPTAYYAQCVHYMALTGASKWYLAVLVLNRGFHVFEIPRDENEIAALVEMEREFWQHHVCSQIPPMPDGSSCTGETIKAMFPEGVSRETVPLFGQEAIIASYLELDRAVKDMEKQRDAFKQTLQLALGDAEIGKAHGYSVEWKNQTRQTLDTKRLQEEQFAVYTAYLKPAQTVRVFKVKEEK